MSDTRNKSVEEIVLKYFVLLERNLSRYIKAKTCKIIVSIFWSCVKGSAVNDRISVKSMTFTFAFEGNSSKRKFKNKLIRILFWQLSSSN